MRVQPEWAGTTAVGARTIFYCPLRNFGAAWCVERSPDRRTAVSAVNATVGEPLTRSRRRDACGPLRPPRRGRRAGGRPSRPSTRPRENRLPAVAGEDACAPLLPPRTGCRAGGRPSRPSTGNVGEPPTRGRRRDACGPVVPRITGILPRDRGFTCNHRQGCLCYSLPWRGRRAGGRPSRPSTRPWENRLPAVAGEDACGPVVPRITGNPSP